MTDAPKKTWRERREDCTHAYINETLEGFEIDEVFVGNIFYDGFDAGRADALKEAQVLVEALEFECDGTCARGINPCNAREVLDKWKEEMGE